MKTGTELNVQLLHFQLNQQQLRFDKVTVFL